MASTPPDYMASIRTSFQNLCSLQSECTGARLTSSQSVTKNASNLCEDFSAKGFLSSAIDDAQTLLDMIKYIDFVEHQRDTFQSELEQVRRENVDLQDDLHRVRHQLAISEQNLIQMEIDKQHTDFLTANQLHTDPAEVDSAYLSVPASEISLNSNSTSKRTPSRRILASKENTPLQSNSKNAPGNYTIMMNKTFATAEDELDLEELTDKLSWYESVIRKLQKILGAEFDDGDVTYHEECNKVLERAKRMADYREMIQDYEKTIGEHKDETSRLKNLLERDEHEKVELEAKVKKYRREVEKYQKHARTSAAV